MYAHKRQLGPLQKKINQYIHVFPDTYMMELRNYIGFGLGPGSFHTALYSNNLRAAVRHAAVRHSDLHNTWEWIMHFIEFLEQEAPAECWGSRDRVDKWIRMSFEERFEILRRRKLVLTEEEVTWDILVDE